jgi:hypothetical protein
MKKIFELKEINKTLAKQIKEKKVDVKKTQREGKYAGKLQYELLDLKWLYRKQHIAYCLLRGKSYEQIEKPRKENELNEEAWKQINQIKEAYHEEDVCIGS